MCVYKTSYKSIQGLRNAGKFIHCRSQEHVNVHELSKDFPNLNLQQQPLITFGMSVCVLPERHIVLHLAFALLSENLVKYILHAVK